jgi:3-hydroxyacyl-CoA dehydrogenase/enoyl-CoA hydratase/3-hydroxybutyryl-CoA epimerase
MVEGAQVDFDTALRIESRYLARLGRGPCGQEHGQHVLLQHERDQERVKVARQDVPRFKPTKRGRFGCRHDGRWHCVCAGQQAALHHRAQGHHPRQSRIGQGLQPQAHAAACGQGPHERTDQAAFLARITATDKATDLKGCDLIIETVFEQRELKAMVTQEAEPMLAKAGSSHPTRPRCPSPAWPRPAPARKICRHPFLQPGGQDEAGGNHPRQTDR